MCGAHMRIKQPSPPQNSLFDPTVASHEKKKGTYLLDKYFSFSEFVPAYSMCCSQVYVSYLLWIRCVGEARLYGKVVMGVVATEQ